jgi:hypothetical protein
MLKAEYHKSSPYWLFLDPEHLLFRLAKGFRGHSVYRSGGEPYSIFNVTAHQQGVASFGYAISFPISLLLFYYIISPLLLFTAAAFFIYPTPSPS